MKAGRQALVSSLLISLLFLETKILGQVRLGLPVTSSTIFIKSRVQTVTQF